MAKPVVPTYFLAKRKSVKISLGQELELKSAPGKTWNVLKGEDVKEIEVYRKHALVDKKGVTIGEAEHTGSVRLVSEPVTGKTYAIGDVKCTHKFTKSGKNYIMDGTESMKQEVLVSDVDFPNEFAADTIFFNLRINSLTQDGTPKPVVAVESPINKPGYRIHFKPTSRQLYPWGYEPTWNQRRWVYPRF